MQSSIGPFPKDFRFGVATAAIQIEGARESRGESNWDAFAEQPGAIFEGHDARTACDHVGHLEEDLELLAGLGVDAYRFSVSWPRLLPEGRGRVNDAGLAFYDRLIDGLLARGIEPYLTLFHWDLPQALEREGGFRARSIERDFANYVELVARRFGDRVRRFITLNEPHAFIEGGLSEGRHAPGLRLPLKEVLCAAHHALLCHASAVEVLRAHVKDCWITAAPVLISAFPDRDCPEDVEAARRATFALEEPKLRSTSFWMDPIYLGRFPESAERVFGADMPRVTDEELRRISAPLDACGVNLYDAVRVRAGRDGEPEIVPPKPGAARTAFNWLVTPEAHEYGPMFLAERYEKPVLITENGLSTRDWVHLDGSVPDPERIDFLRRHLAALSRAVARGVPVLGYLHWSLLDNFEWNHGYRERFGLVYVDFETGRRIPKASYFAYRDLIAQAKAAHR